MQWQLIQNVYPCTSVKESPAAFDVEVVVVRPSELVETEEPSTAK